MDEQEYKQLLIRIITAAIVIDGVIDDKEIQVARHIVQSENIASYKDSEETVRQLIAEVEDKGSNFANDIMREVRRASLNKEQCLNVLKQLFTIIVSDDDIDYREVRFFKKIRKCFTCRLTDSEIMQHIPDISKSFLAPDVYDIQ